MSENVDQSIERRMHPTKHDLELKYGKGNSGKRFLQMWRYQTMANIANESLCRIRKRIVVPNRSMESPNDLKLKHFSKKLREAWSNKRFLRENTFLQSEVSEFKNSGLLSLEKHLNLSKGKLMDYLTGSSWDEYLIREALMLIPNEPEPFLRTNASMAENFDAFFRNRINNLFSLTSGHFSVNSTIHEYTFPIQQSYYSHRYLPSIRHLILWYLEFIHNFEVKYVTRYNLSKNIPSIRYPAQAEINLSNWLDYEFNHSATDSKVVYRKFNKSNWHHGDIGFHPSFNGSNGQKFISFLKDRVRDYIHVVTAFRYASANRVDGVLPEVFCSKNECSLKHDVKTDLENATLFFRIMRSLESKVSPKEALSLPVVKVLSYDLAARHEFSIQVLRGLARSNWTDLAGLLYCTYKPYHGKIVDKDRNFLKKIQLNALEKYPREINWDTDAELSGCPCYEMENHQIGKSILKSNKKRRFIVKYVDESRSLDDGLLDDDFGNHIPSTSSLKETKKRVRFILPVEM